MVAESLSMELIDVVDMQPAPGEYAGCRHEQEPIDVFGITVQAWHRVHAERLAVNRLWQSRCECCGAHLRYAHIAQDADGKYHCLGYDCLNVTALGERSARMLQYSQKIEQKPSGGWCATFNVPQKFWDLPREQRPQFARLWKGKSFGRRAGVCWKLSIWGDSREQCLEACMVLDELLGVKLS